MLEHIKLSQIISMSKLHLNLSHLWFLEKMASEEPIEMTDELELLKQGLIRKKLLTERGKLNKEGKKFLETIQHLVEHPTDIKHVQKHIVSPNLLDVDTIFHELWSIFPSNDSIYKVHNQLFYHCDAHKPNIAKAEATYTGVRSLKNLDDTDAKSAFRKHVNTGIEAIDILNATIADINSKVIATHKCKGKTNHLSFIKNCNAYLKEGAFNAFLGKEIPSLSLEKQVTSYLDNVG